MRDFIPEACVDSVESALAAEIGGANRLELCGNLIIGGTTPSRWLYEEIRKVSDIRIHALHMSGKKLVVSSMIYRKKGINMGLPSLSEFEICQTDEDKIREARSVLDSL